MNPFARRIWRLAYAPDVKINGCYRQGDLCWRSIGLGFYWAHKA